MKLEELKKQLETLDFEKAELRSSIATLKDMNEIAETKAKLEANEEKRSKVMKEIAEFNRPEDNGKEDRSLYNSKNWLKASSEKRSITIGGTGSILQVKELFKEVAEKDDLLNSATFFYGPNASTNIPVLSPMSDPTAQAEGSTTVGSDTAAAVTVTKLEPYAYARVLPITAEMLTMGSVNLESEVTPIFEKAFRKVMHTQMLTGDGTTGNMKGIFTSANANTSGQTQTATIGKVTISELAGLALKVSAYDEDYTLIMNPSIYQILLSDSSTSEDVKIYKEGLIRDKTIEGVKIILDNKAPNAVTSGSVLIAGLPLSRFAIGVAGEMTIDPIKVKGDTNTYYQATMFFNGKQIADSDVVSIVSK